MGKSVASIELATPLTTTATAAGVEDDCLCAIDLSSAQFGAIGDAGKRDYTWLSAQTDNYADLLAGVICPTALATTDDNDTPEPA